MYAATREAREKAVSGEGPTLIEAVTYRFGPHTTADDPTKYRKRAEVEEWKLLDPILRLQKYLRNKACGTKTWRRTAKAEAEANVNQAVQEAEEFPPPEVEDMFRYTYAEMTPDLKRADGGLPGVSQGKGELTDGQEEPGGSHQQRASMEEMERDPSVVILGEDVGKEGGVFRVTDGLQAQVRSRNGSSTPPWPNPESWEWPSAWR